MATKYVLQIDPKISADDAKKTENQLNSRFAKVAKNYGDEMRKQNEKVTSGFSSHMKLALGKLKVGWIALAGAVASVLTNPFDEVDAKLNELLSKFDNISTRAKQWGVDPTRFWLLNQVGKIAGVPEGGIENALLRIADRLEMARTGEDPTLKNYLDEQDIIDVFYKLSQTWNRMNPTERGASMADILGTRQANVFAELVQSDWNKLAQTAMAGYDWGDLGKSIDKLADLEEQQAIQRAQLETRELMSGSAMISRSTLQSQVSVELAKQRNILDKMAQYATYASTEVTTLNIKNAVNDIKTDVQDIATRLADYLGVNGQEGRDRSALRFQERLKKSGWRDDGKGGLRPPTLKESIDDAGGYHPIWTKEGWANWKKSWGLGD